MTQQGRQLPGLRQLLGVPWPSKVQLPGPWTAGSQKSDAPERRAVYSKGSFFLGFYAGCAAVLLALGLILLLVLLGGSSPLEVLRWCYSPSASPQTQALWPWDSLPSSRLLIPWDDPASATNVLSASATNTETAGGPGGASGDGDAQNMEGVREDAGSRNSTPLAPSSHSYSISGAAFPSSVVTSTGDGTHRDEDAAERGAAERDAAERGAAERGFPEGGAAAPMTGEGRVLAQWHPSPGQYLLVHCYLGRWSNYLFCMERALVWAGLLNRTLLIPERPVCVNTTFNDSFAVDMLDVDHLKACLHRSYQSGPEHSLHAPSPNADFVMGPGGPHALLQAGSGAGQAAPRVATLAEYLSAAGTYQLKVDMLLCQICPLSWVCPSTSTVSFPESTPMAGLNWRFPILPRAVYAVARASAGKAVLSLGDTFHSNVKGFAVAEGASLGRMLRSHCGSLLQPTPRIFAAARAFMAAHLPPQRRYAALHFRRMDFAEHLTRHKHTPHGLSSVVECVAPRLHKAGLSTLFVAAYASEQEVTALRDAFAAQGITSVFALDHRDSIQGLTELQVALVEKVVCAHARQFTRQPWSTFSYRILQLRHGLGFSSPQDEGLCGEEELDNDGYVLTRTRQR